jgi:hypothetical protein
MNLPVAVDPGQIIQESNRFSDAIASVSAADPAEAAAVALRVCELVRAWSANTGASSSVAALRRTTDIHSGRLAVELELAAVAERQASHVEKAVARLLTSNLLYQHDALGRIKLLLLSIASLFYRIDAVRLRELKRRNSFDYESLRA